MDRSRSEESERLYHARSRLDTLASRANKHRRSRWRKLAACNWMGCLKIERQRYDFSQAVTPHCAVAPLMS